MTLPASPARKGSGKSPGHANGTDAVEPGRSLNWPRACALRALGEEHTSGGDAHAGTTFELRRGQFEVELDGTVIGAIAYGETIEVPIDSGHHVLKIRSGRYCSRDRAFDMADGDVAEFRCHGALIWPLWLASFAIPDLAITLKRQ